MNKQVKYRSIKPYRSPLSWKSYLILLLSFCVPLNLLRCYQFSCQINMHTGYFTATPLSPILLYAGILLFFLVLALILIRSNPFPFYMDQKNPYLLQIGALLTGICCLLYPLLNLQHTLEDPSDRIPFLCLISLFSFLASLGFFYLVWRIKKPTGSIADILLGFPSLFCGFMLLSMFMEHTVVVTVSENVLNIARMACEAIFLITAAKSLIRFSSPTNERWMILSGILAILLGTLTTIPPCIGMFLGIVYISKHVLITSPLDGMLWLFTALFLFYYFFAIEKRK